MFSKEVGIDLKAITDLELGHRRSFSPELLELFEAKYRLVRGSLERAISSGGVPAPEEKDGRVIRRMARGVTVEIAKTHELAGALTPAQREEMCGEAAEAAARAAEEYSLDHGRLRDG